MTMVVTVTTTKARTPAMSRAPPNCQAPSAMRAPARARITKPSCSEPHTAHIALL